MPLTLKEVRQTLALTEFNDCITATITAVTNGSQFSAATLSTYPDGHLNGRNIHIFNANYNNNNYFVVNQVGEVITCTPFDPQVQIGTVVELYKEFTAKQYNKAIVRAFVDLQGRVFKPMSDRYIPPPMGGSPPPYLNIPTTMVGLEDVIVDGEMLSRSDWSINRHERKIVLNNIPNPTSIVFYGIGYATTPTSDTSAVELDNEYIINKAAAYLHRAKAGSSATDPDNHMQRALICEQEAQKKLQRIPQSIPPNCRKV